MGHVAQFFRNLFAGDMPFPRRLAMFARNYATRFTARSSCCGHPGEPGC